MNNVFHKSTVAVFSCVLISRDFLEQHYVSLKQNNPKFPVLVRECSGVQPMIWARYGTSIHCPVRMRDRSSGNSETVDVNCSNCI